MDNNGAVGSVGRLFEERTLSGTTALLAQWGPSEGNFFHEDMNIGFEM